MNFGFSCGVIVFICPSRKGTCKADGSHLVQMAPDDCTVPILSCEEAQTKWVVDTQSVKLVGNCGESFLHVL